MSNLYPTLSGVQQKRQAFHKQIRSKHRQQYFKTQRKLLIQAQLMNSNQQFGYNGMVLKSMRQVQIQLTSDYSPDYSSIDHYFQTHKNQLVPEHIISIILNQSIKPRFMKDQHGIVLLMKLFNLKEFNSQQRLTGQLVINLIENVIRQNIVLQDPHHRIYRLNYFTTICWFLFVIGVLTKDNGLMMPIKQHLPMMQAQAYHQLPFEFISLLSQLSTSSQLMPSQQFIQRLLTYEPLQSQPIDYLVHQINLLDNYLRYRCQKLYRFDDQESFQLTVGYFRFINKKVKNLKFPNKLKVDLINLVSTIVNSSSDQLVKQLFNTPQSHELCQQIFYRAQFAQWQSKSACFLCFTGILCHQILLPKVIQYIDPARIAYLCVNSMTLPDRNFQMSALACINILLNQQFNVFHNLIKYSEYLKNVKLLELSDEKYPQINGVKMSLADIAMNIYDRYFAI